MSEVLVIIVSYNAMKWVDSCLGSLRASTVPADAVVIDNGSTDGTVGYIREHYPEVRVYETGSNLGFGAGNNLGLRLAVEQGYEYVYLLNQDAWILPDTLGLMIPRMKDGYGLLSPRQMSADRSTMDAYFQKHCGRYIEGNGAHTVEVPFVMAAHWLLSRDAILRVGGFSPAFHQYGEDINWIDRLHYAGLKAGVVPAAKAVHDRSMRKRDLEGAMKVKFSGSWAAVSNPGRPMLLSYLFQTCRLLAIALRRQSMIPIRFLSEFWGSWNRIAGFRNLSKVPGAFLDQGTGS